MNKFLDSYFDLADEVSFLSALPTNLLLDAGRLAAVAAVVHHSCARFLRVDLPTDLLHRLLPHIAQFTTDIQATRDLFGPAFAAIFDVLLAVVTQLHSTLQAALAAQGPLLPPLWVAMAAPLLATAPLLLLAVTVRLLVAFVRLSVLILPAALRAKLFLLILAGSVNRARLFSRFPPLLLRFSVLYAMRIGALALERLGAWYHDIIPLAALLLFTVTRAASDSSNSVCVCICWFVCARR